MTILAAKPKSGKSWWALAASVAVSNGSRFLGIPVSAGEVLYIGAEDTCQRLRSRLHVLCKEDKPNGDLHLAVTWPILSEGGLDRIGNWLGDHRRARLVVLDTLGRLSGASGGSAYARQYESLAALKSLADRRRVGLLAISHLRKSGAGNWTDSIQGSTAVSGAADCLIGISRGRNQDEAVMQVTGRDVEEQETLVHFDATAGRWRIVGDAHERFLSPERQAILGVVKGAPEPMGAKAVSVVLGTNPNTTRKLMGYMAKQGLILRAVGGYVPALKPEPAVIPGTPGSAGSGSPQTASASGLESSVEGVGDLASGATASAGRVIPFVLPERLPPPDFPAC